MWIGEVLGDSDVVVHRYYLKVIDSLRDNCTQLSLT